MKLVHLKASDYVTSTWAGGTTTQLGIAPAGAVYVDRDFIWRISSATVDLEVSDFTALPDYNRLISTLEGEIDVTHNGGEVIHLAPFHVHAFDGGWETRSVGRCRDFNLMMRKGVCAGQMNAVTAPAVVKVEEAAKDAKNADAILYCAVGSASVEVAGQTVVLQSGESVLIQDAASAELTITGDAKLMFTAAWY